MNPTVALITALIQAGPALAEDIIQLWKGNPQQQAEADDAYITRLGAMLDQDVQEVEAGDKEVQS